MNVARSISVSVLAILVMVSSTSFAVGVHFCRGDVQSISFFSKGPGCEKEQRLPACHRNVAPRCCDDQLVVHEGTDFESFERYEVSPVVPVAITQALHLIAELFPPSDGIRRGLHQYDPPLPSMMASDRIVVLQVFLI